jgi:hypothetical protein
MNHMHIRQRSIKVDATTCRVRRPGGASRRIVRSFNTRHGAKTFATGVRLCRQRAEVDRGQITPDLTAGWQNGRLQAGIDQCSVRRALLVLSGIPQTAVRSHGLAINSARNVHAAGSAS